MPTTHEELLTLKTQLNASLDEYTYMRTGLRGKAPVFGFKKYLKDYSIRVNELKESYDALDVKYLDAFADVLKENHGVSWNNLVNLQGGKCMDPTHSFTALIGNKIRNMEAVSVGNRIVFFLDGVALGENEKADYGTINA